MDDAMESALPNTSSGVTITRRFADGEGLKMKDSVDEPRLWLRVTAGPCHELSDFEVLRDAILAIHETVLTIDEDT